jgi:hypothetical protein
MLFKQITYLDKSILLYQKTKQIIIFVIYNGSNMFSPSRSESEAKENLKH